MTETAYLRLAPLASGPVLVTMDDPSGRANRTTDQFKGEMEILLSAWEAAPPPGIIIVSAKKSFGVGGDIGQVMDYAETGEAASIADSERIKALFRRLETLRCPVVAVIEGTAAGGGWELALACHARFALADPAIRLGFPEVDFGLVPGAGGMLRLTHLLGSDRAAALICNGRMQSPDQALAEGLLNALAPDRGALIAAAVDWIHANPAPRQPWDRPHHSLPPQPVLISPTTTAAPGLAAESITAIAATPFAAGSMIESRCFARCATSEEARALIGLRFQDRNTLRRLSPAPDLAPLAEPIRRALAEEVALLLAEGIPSATISAAAETVGYAPITGLAGGPLAEGGGLVPLFHGLARRLLLAQTAAAVGFLPVSAAALNSASVEGGFPLRTGGVLRFVTACGVDSLIAEAERLGARYALPPADELSALIAGAQDQDREPQGSYA